MRKFTVLTAMLAVVFTLVQFACQPAADTNRSEVAAPGTNSGKETVDTAAIEAELLRIENDWPRVVKEKDVAAVGRVEADDAVMVTPDGSVVTKADDLRDIASGAMTADTIEIKELKVKVLDSDAAVVIGHNALRNGKIRLPDGKIMDISGEYRFVDTFARRNGEWKLVAGIATKIANPAAAAKPAASPTPAASTSPAVKASPKTSATPAPTMKAAPATSAKPAPAVSPATTRPTP